MADAWTTRLLNAGSEGTLGLALALGQELGIFDVISASPQPMTSDEIAEKGKLKERYVREWLGCVLAGQVIQATGDNPVRYFIADDHKAALNGIGIAARLFASYAVRYDAVKDCFRQDGPKDKGIEVAEFGCGTGVLILELAARYPNSRFYGSDISSDALAIAKKKLAETGLTNVKFSQADLNNLPDDMHGNFHWALTFDVIHDLAHPLKALMEIHKSLRPGGLCIIGDIHAPEDRHAIVGDDNSMSLYGMSTFLCLPASADQDGALGPGAAWSVREAEELITNSKFTLQETVRRPDHPHFAFHVCRKDDTE